MKFLFDSHNRNRDRRAVNPNDNPGNWKNILKRTEFLDDSSIMND